MFSYSQRCTYRGKPLQIETATDSKSVAVFLEYMKKHESLRPENLVDSGIVLTIVFYCQLSVRIAELTNRVKVLTAAIPVGNIGTNASSSGYDFTSGVYKLHVRNDLVLRNGTVENDRDFSITNNLIGQVDVDCELDRAIDNVVDGTRTLQDRLLRCIPSLKDGEFPGLTDTIKIRYIGFMVEIQIS